MQKVTLPDGRVLAYNTQICPVRHILDGVGDKWTILVLAGLGTGTKRFSELRRLIPDISQRMLTKTLRKLERDGLVLRDVTPSIPPRVDYTLTAMGQDLCTQLTQLAEWAKARRPDFAQARAIYDDRTGQ